MSNERPLAIIFLYFVLISRNVLEVFFGGGNARSHEQLFRCEQTKASVRPPERRRAKKNMEQINDVKKNNLF